MKTFMPSGFAFLLLVFLFLFNNQDIRGQWELLLNSPEKNWRVGRIVATSNGGLIGTVQRNGLNTLIRINQFGEVVSKIPFGKFDLPDYTTYRTDIYPLENGDCIIIHRMQGITLSRVSPYGKLIWKTDIESLGDILEMESGDLLQVFAGEQDELSSYDIITNIFSGADGTLLSKKNYGNQKDEYRIKKRKNNDGSFTIAGETGDAGLFFMTLSALGDSINGFHHVYESKPATSSSIDLALTSDGGIVSVLNFNVYPDNYPTEPSITNIVIDKLNNKGVLEMRKTHEKSNTDEFCEFNFFTIKEGSPYEYLIESDYLCEDGGETLLMKFNHIGDLLWEGLYSFDAGYTHDNVYCDSCGCAAVGTRINNIRYLSNGDYMLSGFNYINRGNGYSCSNRIPLIAKIDGDGNIKWKEHYDLGNPYNIIFEGRTVTNNMKTNLFIGAQLLNIGTGQNWGNATYIISTDSNGIRYTNSLSGFLYLDSNENCEIDAEERSYPSYISIKSSTINRYITVDENGYFSTKLPKGNYTISYTLDSDLVESICEENQYTISFPENYDTISNLNFPLHAIVECPKLEVEIGTPLLRRCFKNTYKISYCNKGTLAAEDAKITLEFPDEMIPLESSMEALQEGNQWTFDLGMVDIGECGFFTVVDSISCEADLGSTICLKSRILPDTPCEAPSPLWDGSNIEVKGECLEDHLRFTLENIGSGNMNEERNFYVYENNVLTETGKIQLKSQERLQLQLSPNGKALRLKVEQSPHFPITEDQPQTTVEACGEGNFSFGYINSVEQNDRYPSVDIDCQEIIGSFDPNDIQVYPIGISDQHFIEENTKLTYKIRFQNTGNDTAFRVMIVDTLPKELEGASLNLGNSSHDYSFVIKFGNLLVWTFDNILLPDSTTNERESHGFVQFSIYPKAGIEQGTRIENKADIYFDFNAPIATNEVFNTVTDDLGTDYGEPLTLYHLFIDFTTELLDNGKIEVQWITVNTGQIHHFEVERSPNPHSFETIHNALVQEGEEEFHLYQFEDEYNGNENILYYRIKAIDIAGDHEYTLIKTVYLKDKPAQYEVWSSNRKQTLIEWLGEKDKTYTIRVFNTAGQYLWNFDVYAFHSLMPSLDSNLYILQVIDSHGKTVKTQKVFGL